MGVIEGFTVYAAYYSSKMDQILRKRHIIRTKIHTIQWQIVAADLLVGMLWTFGRVCVHMADFRAENTCIPHPNPHGIN